MLYNIYHILYIIVTSTNARPNGLSQSLRAVLCVRTLKMIRPQLSNLPCDAPPGRQ